LILLGLRNEPFLLSFKAPVSLFFCAWATLTAESQGYWLAQVQEEKKKKPWISIFLSYQALFFGRRGCGTGRTLGIGWRRDRKAASGTGLAFWSLQRRRSACLAAAPAMQTGTALRGASWSLAVAERPPGIPTGGGTSCAT